MESAAAAAAAGSEDVEMDTDAAKEVEAARPDFPALTAREMGGGKDDFRRIRCPPHRLTPLRNSWENIVTPTVEHMKLQIRYDDVAGWRCWFEAFESACEPTFCTTVFCDSLKVSVSTLES